MSVEYCSSCIHYKHKEECLSFRPYCDIDNHELGVTQWACWKNYVNKYTGKKRVWHDWSKESP